MERSRSSSYSKIPISADQMEHTPYYTSLSHSRESSAASTTSIPLTPAFSTRSHGHWSNSGSSVTSAPDSPIVTKSPLGDLVEDPEEIEEFSFDLPLPIDDALCMCDTAICHHQGKTARSVTGEYSAGDDTTLTRRTSKRRKSSEYSMDALTTKFGRRFPSISRRWRDSQPTTSLSNPQVRSAAPSRSSSLRLPKVQRSLNDALDTRRDRSSSMNSQDWYHYKAPAPLNITAPPTPIDEDPIDRMELSRTPLLPPLLHDMRSYSEDNVVIQSPLQSPSFAPPSAASSAIASPMSAPALGYATPPLSARPSYASFHHGMHDIPTMHLQPETDPWALKLGHANYHIIPEPYLPTECTQNTCKRLLDDWETARTEYMRQAARVREEYGFTSDTFKLTEQKWDEIDTTWRSNYELANAKAGASGESLVYQPLAETTKHRHMPSIDQFNTDPSQPAKFPVVYDIVGPMVQYTKVNHTPAKKPGLLRIFTDPASILGKSTFSFKR